MYYVNKVGININTTNVTLLSYASDIAPKLTESIANYRNQHCVLNLEVKKRDFYRLH